MNKGRRDLLVLGGGAAAGAMLSPAPWRLLGDTAIWTQNWSWMPRIPRGESTYKEITCTLCPAACPMKAHCVGQTPVAMQPRERAVCPAGLVGHHLALHPLRLRQTLHQGQSASHPQALEAARSACRRGRAALLDLQPGRVASRLHRENMQFLGGLYLTPPPVIGATAQAQAPLLAKPGTVSINLAAAKTVLSLSTPLLEGWASPQLSTHPSFRLLQAEARKSCTAERADQWISIKPGGEAALLLALLGEVAGSRPAIRKMEEFQTLAAALNGIEEHLAARAGLSRDAVASLARLLEDGPALVVADGDPIGGPLAAPAAAAAAALNAALGGEALRVGPAAPAAFALDQVEDGSLHLLLIDEPLPGLAFPWALAAPKLAPGATVIALTWNSRQFAANAGWLVPVPVFLEGKHEAAPRPDATPASLAISEGWLAPPADALCAADFVSRLAGNENTYEAALAENAAASSPATAAFHPARVLPLQTNVEQWVNAALADPPEVAVVAYGWPLASVSPLLAKLWKEAEIKKGPSSAEAHPDTARQLHRATLETNPAVQPGVVELCAGPAYTQRCQPAPSGAWIPAATSEVHS